MKHLILAAALSLFATAAQAQYLGTGTNPNTHTSSGYTNTHGTYVQPYVATNPNSTQRDNATFTTTVTEHGISCGRITVVGLRFDKGVIRERVRSFQRVSFGRVTGQRSSADRPEQISRRRVADGGLGHPDRNCAVCVILRSGSGPGN